jgi:hypothetical protein
MTTKEAGADRRALAAGMIRLLGLSAGYGETNKYVEQRSACSSWTCIWLSA